MKKTLALVAVIALFPLLAHASCDTVKSQIDAKLKANHVAHYTLDVVSADQAGSSGGKVVGSCEGGSKKIVYTRGTSSSASDGKTTSSGDGSAPASSSSSGN